MVLLGIIAGQPLSLFFGVFETCAACMHAHACRSRDLFFGVFETCVTLLSILI